MRDMAGKMAELKFEAPLAQFEESEEWPQTTGTTALSDNTRPGADPAPDDNFNPATNGEGGGSNTPPGEQLDNDAANKQFQELQQQQQTTTTTITADPASVSSDTFNEMFSGSLEDLVNTFDEKITRCFCNYDESVEKLAPVQVRSQEEIMNECQMWWTITGNFGNILPIDWSKSYARKLHMPTLNLNENNKDKPSPDEDPLDLSSEDEAVASDLDMHALILSGLNADKEPIKTADEVIREIDDMMQETPSTECSPDSDSFLDSTDALDSRSKEVLQSPLYEDKLKTLGLSQLNELYLELEVLIREFSETLIAELALRDELEYEKELKNTFISLLLAVQNRRRQYHVERKRGSRNGTTRTPNGLDPKYLTTVIPYHLGSGPPDNQALQVLIKILKAINEDSPTVPTLLTDYILKVLCPT
ncbi:fasciculation and elongation protein zeta-2 [Schistocerca gregaria]|uniref:fasciculation and elongation protein zeta-2 n=1 Tax=Schistocerca gregaria TaxID=7010 RepID=UPI00211DE315|nr:fasciculation and elongation protein zeta-2 [Schistocerca gregaria]